MHPTDRFLEELIGAGLEVHEKHLTSAPGFGTITQKFVEASNVNPVGEITALISAETGDGAAGCASGSHTCSGSSPALAPKPSSARKNARLGHAPPRCCARMPANV